MRVRTYIYDGAATADRVETVLDRLADRDEPVEHVDVAAADDPDAARREAMLTLRESMRIGENPAGIYDDEGTPDFATGVLITEAETGRRSVHLGTDALEALEDDEDTEDDDGDSDDDDESSVGDEDSVGDDEDSVGDDEDSVDDDGDSDDDGERDAM